MSEHEVLKAILDNWQVVFLYGIKILRDMQIELAKLRAEMNFLKERI